MSNLKQSHDFIAYINDKRKQVALTVMQKVLIIKFLNCGATLRHLADAYDITDGKNDTWKNKV